MNSLVKNLLLLTLLVAIVLGVRFYWLNLRGTGPALKPPPDDIVDQIGDSPTSGENLTDFPLNLPPGFQISILSDNVPDVRDMVMDRFGNIWVSQPDEGTVSLLTIQNGRLANQNAIFRGLNRPHGLAFDPDNPLMLYIAQSDGVYRIQTYSEGRLEKIIDLPPGGRHFTRSIIFKDNKLLISVGSSCDTCEESDWRRAKILQADKDGSNLEVFAEGLRNAVFMTKHPETDEVWVTEMGRDFLGDNLPPDEINIVREELHYGWPYCYGKQMHDKQFDPSGAREEFCTTTQPSHINIQAHSAPLGLDFYQGDLLVAYHGSWNRSVPTGYKLVRMKLDDDRNLIEAEDFITGWLVDEGALGRPVDILVNDNLIYVSDDHAGVIYQITTERR